jgi:hypothetical protein
MLEGITEENLKAVEKQLAVLHKLARDYKASGQEVEKKAALEYVAECNKLLSALRENNIAVLTAPGRKPRENVMTHLIFTHGRWHRFKPHSTIADHIGSVKEKKEPKPGDTFSELGSPLWEALKDLRAQFLDAYLLKGVTWKIEKPEEQKP